MKLLALNAKVKRTAQNSNPTNKTNLAKKYFVDADSHKCNFQCSRLTFKTKEAARKNIEK
ncbi:hypothetical protein APQ14_05490 [Vibrio toranzoniae]|uniref:Uncharacterized protein n=1 Tax=Vibrio toranzoniae TaxID=1194427 RepID=A0A109DA63_9VIBR|nr:hypothetical protein APQ14_05490 [Vibrio toranzoniae]